MPTNKLQTMTLDSPKASIKNKLKLNRKYVRNYTKFLMYSKKLKKKTSHMANKDGNQPSSKLKKGSNRQLINKTYRINHLTINQKVKFIIR